MHRFFCSINFRFFRAVSLSCLRFSTSWGSMSVTVEDCSCTDGSTGAVTSKTSWDSTENVPSLRFPALSGMTQVSWLRHPNCTHFARTAVLLGFPRGADIGQGFFLPSHCFDPCEEILKRRNPGEEDPCLVGLREVQEETSVKTVEFPTIKSRRISNTLLASAITLYLPVTKWSEQMVLDFGGLYDDPSGFSRWSAVSHLSLRSGFKCRFGNSKNDLFTSLTPSYLWSLFVQPTTTQFLGILTNFNAKTCCVTRSLWQLLRCCCQRLPGCYLIIHKRSRMLRVEN